MGSQSISDDGSLLDSLKMDYVNLPEIYRPVGPTNEFTDQFLSDLKDLGLRKMLATGSKLLNTVGGCDYSPLQQAGYNLNKKLQEKLISQREHDVLLEASKIAFEKSSLQLSLHEVSLVDLNETAYRVCNLYGKLAGAGDLSKISMSDVTNPEYYFTVDGKKYSLNFLYYYLRYAYCCQFVDFEKIDNIVEIGSGFGRAAEVIKIFHPHIRFYLFDLPAQTYCTHQFLKSVFGSAVLPYQQGRMSGDITIAEKGKIGTYLPDRIERIRPQGVTLSFSTMVYCVMKPKLVRHYFKHLKFLASYIFLNEPSTDACAQIYRMEVAPDFALYESCLKDDFVLQDKSCAFRPLTNVRAWGGVDNSFWIRK